ncbi:UbiD family decarboxylase [Burkholderia ubonensis]|uniref:UbiD family decarboxylase n=1 Tax=Burkholderia ubonensis TaxID=101571 RepID=A0ABD4DUE7_9BURK|nr:UbiD family decarboxylase [Burkholderia ubonensis]KVN74077.1 hypothetical protein WJ68_29225 [Burkholderia ubonensis]KVZ88844.1 hypothetical protein WL24_05130 [Burkholderia ubonensis]
MTCAASDIHDLRSALDALARAGERPVEIDAPLDPHVGLIDDYLGSYRASAASWFAAEQPLRLYRRPARGRFPVLMGLFGSRARTGVLLGDDRPGERIARAIRSPLAPTLSARATPREWVTAPDLRQWLPALTCTAGDPGPTVTLGLVYARDAITGIANCSVHRITLKPSSTVVAISSKGHLQQLVDRHVARGERLPVSVNIGLDPALYYAAALSSPAVGFGDDELAVAGALRGRPVALAPCASGGGWYVDHAEIVIEGSLGADKEAEHDGASAGPPGHGHSMPEYLGYFSAAGAATTLAVSALSWRPGAIYPALTGPGREQSELLGVGQEAAIWRVLHDEGVAPLFRDAVALPAGGGHLFTVLQVARRTRDDDAPLLNAAMRLLERVATTKNLVLVDDDVNPHSADDVLWAIATRSRLERDVLQTQSLRGTSLDPTQSESYVSGGQKGFTNKCVIDCLVPFGLRERFRRAYA